MTKTKIIIRKAVYQDSDDGQEITFTPDRCSAFFERIGAIHKEGIRLDALTPKDTVERSVYSLRNEEVKLTYRHFPGTRAELEFEGNKGEVLRLEVFI